MLTNFIPTVTLRIILKHGYKNKSDMVLMAMGIKIIGINDNRSIVFLP